MTEADDVKKGRKMRPYPRFDADDRNYPFSERTREVRFVFLAYICASVQCTHGSAVFVQVLPV